MSMVSISRLPVLALACALAAGFASGEELGAVTDPLLRRLIDEALAANADVAAAREASAAARSRPAQARVLPDPMVSVAYVNDGWSPSLGSQEMTTLGFMWSQALPFPGKRRLRADVLAEDTAQAEQALERVRLGVAASVKRAYYGAALTGELLELIREREEFWTQIEGVARARYAVGQGAQQDVLRAQIEVARTRQLRAEQEAEAEVRVAELNRLLGRPADASLETPASLALGPVETGLDAALEWVTALSPELKAAGSAVEQGRLALALARKEFKPDLALQVGYMNRGGLDPMWQAGASVSLPIYRKRPAAAVAEAEARLREAERRRESVRLLLRQRTQERLARMRSGEKVTELYANGIIPQDRMSVESAIASYQAGKVPFIAVLEALVTLYGDRATHLRLIVTYQSLRAGLEEASLEPAEGGGVPEPAGMGGAGISRAAAGRAMPETAGGMSGR
jgi:outer membrane protein TolC